MFSDQYSFKNYISFLLDCTERDIFFAIDGAANVGPENFRKQVQFLEQFVQNVDLGSKKIRLGLLQISNKQQTEIIVSFSSSQNPLDIEYILDEMPYYNKPERYLGEALKKIHDSVSARRNIGCLLPLEVPTYKTCYSLAFCKLFLKVVTSLQMRRFSKHYFNRFEFVATC